MQNFSSLWYLMRILLAVSANFPDNPRIFKWLENIFNSVIDIFNSFEDILPWKGYIFNWIKDIFKWIKDIFKWIKDIFKSYLLKISLNKLKKKMNEIYCDGNWRYRAFEYPGIFRMRALCVGGEIFILCDWWMYKYVPFYFFFIFRLFGIKYPLYKAAYFDIVDNAYCWYPQMKKGKFRLIT